MKGAELAQIARVQAELVKWWVRARWRSRNTRLHDRMSGFHFLTGLPTFASTDATATVNRPVRSS